MLVAEAPSLVTTCHAMFRHYFPRPLRPPLLSLPSSSSQNPSDIVFNQRLVAHVKKLERVARRAGRLQFSERGSAYLSSHIAQELQAFLTQEEAAVRV